MSPRPPEGAAAREVIRWAMETFGTTLAVATSLGAEDMVLLHEVAHLHREHGLALPHVFFLDTGRLHEETYALLDGARARYGVPIEVYFPGALLVEGLVRKQGVLGFRASVEARKECCNVRKVQQLGRALAGRGAWVTGLRRDQAVTRGTLATFEVDAAHGGIAKIAPLAGWSEAEVFDYARAHDVPLNPLHAQGFRSIGCAPCTRAIGPDEDVRAGRFYWESPEHKECGLHPSHPARQAEGAP